MIFAFLEFYVLSAYYFVFKPKKKIMASSIEFIIGTFWSFCVQFGENLPTMTKFS